MTLQDNPVSRAPVDLSSSMHVHVPSQISIPSDIKVVAGPHTLQTLNGTLINIGNPPASTVTPMVSDAKAAPSFSLMSALPPPSDGVLHGTRQMVGADLQSVPCILATPVVSYSATDGEAMPVFNSVFSHQHLRS